MYQPLVLPRDAALLSSAVQQELQRLALQLSEPQEYLMLKTLYAAPTKLREGMLVMADGTTWDPGSGAGVYAYRGGAWTFLG